MPAAEPSKRRRNPRQSRQKPARSRDVAKRAVDRLEGPKRWGKVARHGAGTLREDEETASGAWRKAMGEARKRGPQQPPEEWEPERFQQLPEPRTKARRRRAAAPDRSRSTASVPDIPGDKLAKRLADAARAYERDRYPEARKLLRPLADQTPENPAVRELFGLTLYRLGSYRDAIRELRAYINLTGDYDQHPTLADCYRALKRWKAVDDTWNELRDASPSAALVAEGRIVAAGARADRGDLEAAIALLEQARADPKRPRDHHLRLWYAQADLYERAGDLPRARDLFRRVAHHDPDFFDAGQRAKALA